MKSGFAVSSNQTGAAEPPEPGTIAPGFRARANALAVCAAGRRPSAGTRAAPPSVPNTARRLGKKRRFSDLFSMSDPDHFPPAKSSRRGVAMSRLNDGAVRAFFLLRSGRPML
jgi:hypothetical protein